MSQDTDALRRAAKGFLGHSTQSRPPFTDEEADAWLARGSADALALKAAIAALSTAPAPRRVLCPQCHAGLDEDCPRTADRPCARVTIGYDRAALRTTTAPAEGGDQ